MNTSLETPSVLDQMNWRYAVKAFDPNKKLSARQLHELLEVVRMAPTAYGQQPFTVLNIEDPATRTALLSASYGQEKVVNASHLLVFAANTQLNESTVNTYIKQAAQARNVEESALAGFGKVVKQTYAAMTDAELTAWAQKQTYLALGFLLSAAAQLEIDACPMEGFNAAEYNTILGLTQKGLTATVIVTLGFRSANDAAQHLAKVRKPMNQLVETI